MGRRVEWGARSIASFCSCLDDDEDPLFSFGGCSPLMAVAEGIAIVVPPD